MVIYTCLFSDAKHMCLCVYIYSLKKYQETQLTLINEFSTCQVRHILFIFKNMFHVIYSNRSKLKGPMKKKKFNYEKWKGYVMSNLSLLSPHQNPLWS